VNTVDNFARAVVAGEFVLLESAPLEAPLPAISLLLILASRPVISTVRPESLPFVTQSADRMVPALNRLHLTGEVCGRTFPHVGGRLPPLSTGGNGWAIQ
jgi:hypothetical protein